MEVFRENEDMIKKVNWQINEIVRGEPEELYQAAQHLSKAGGKRIRPLICLLSCQSVGGEVEKAMPTAVALELIHTFSLIHDDIMDNDDLRRNLSSVHKVYGEPTAILAGDLLFAKAFELSDAKTKDVLAKASGVLCEGQKMDLSFESRDEVSEEDYLEMIYRKTAALFEASAKAGAILGNAKKELVDSFGDYGKNLGLAFQVYDDILGVAGEEEKVGKPVGSDVAQKKKSLVIIKAIEKLKGSPEGEKLKSILAKEDNTPQEIQEAISLIKNSNSIEYCQGKAESYVEEAKNSLKEIPGSDAKRALIEIANFVTKREK